ncbi:PIG-L family deacetylase [Geodermatophilus sp. TF02-6]|nr:PIG-L family deacetylase [Geodermatophilus sp. TF02-6]
MAARRWPELVPDPGWRTALVCAAHPDDDVLAVGSLMRCLGDAGVALRLLAATDGEGSHPGSSVLDPPELARRRVAEVAAALAVLGVAPAATVRLRLPDSGLAAVEEELTTAVVGAAEGADVVLAPWDGDAHPDHEALGRAAAAAAAAVGAPLLAFPVWTWHWAAPADRRVPWDRARVVRVPPPLRAARRAAVACFATQVRPLGPAPEDAVVLPPEVLAHFDRDVEVVFA